MTRQTAHPQTATISSGMTIEAISGVLEGITFHKAAGALEVTAFGLSVVDLEAGASSYPEHDHSEEGARGRMFAKRPQQLGQEEVYFALRGRGRWKVPDGLRLLAIGGTPGEPYETGGTL